MNPTVTIIICTFNRSDLIQETIPTVFQQDIPSNKYDVIVINNHSTDSTSDILSRYSKKYKNLTVLEEKKQGLSYAKNAGMNAAKTKWIAYLDDDAKVPVDFVNKVLNNINNSNYKCFGGVYLPWYKYGRPKWYQDKYVSNKGKLSEFGTLENDFIAGGIMAIKKSVLMKLGGFHTQIGMTGNSISYGEETLLQIKLREIGYKIGYDPNWKIYHLVGKYKLSPLWFLKSGYVSGRDSWVIYKEKPSVRKILLYFYRSLKMFITNIFYYTPNLLKQEYYFQNWIIDVLRPTILKFGQIYGGIKLICKKHDID